ncbi:MAG: mannitol 2-dehydrogenase [Paracoccaceae bacterium]|jgi:mannitol 2-dehydrogenase
MKIRVLNGGHAIIAYPAALAGVEYVHDAMNVPEIEAFLRKVILDDVAPNVKPVGDQTPQAYMAQTIKRFNNPGVADTIARLCLDGANRQPKFIVPSIRDRLAAGHTPYGLALCCAFWCLYRVGVDDQGQMIPIGTHCLLRPKPQKMIRWSGLNRRISMATFASPKISVRRSRQP